MIATSSAGTAMGSCMQDVTALKGSSHPHRASVIELKKVCGHRKGSAEGNADALSRRPCPESCKYCSRIEKKFGVKDPIVHQFTEPSTSALDPRSDQSVQKDQLADPEIKPIIEFKESFDVKPSWQDITPFHPTTKLYWALSDSLHLRNGVLYQKWEPTLPRSSECNNNGLVVVDYFTKWPETYPISDQKASTVAEVLVQQWISRFGVLLQLHSDQGRKFDSAVSKRLCEIHAIDKTRTTALHPQSDGMVERFNRTIRNSLSLLVSSNQQDWDKKFPFFLLAYRRVVHDATGYFPSQMLFGRDIRLLADLLFS
ncbi:retrovirus-related Pol polyprotein from transposon 412 [Trichonephila clavipes]|nr:retrovirus-related Pol polyprotein from transposon 412 [Trichonephila clavipes]